MKKITLNFLYSIVELTCATLNKLVNFIYKRIEDLEVWATAQKAKL